MLKGINHFMRLTEGVDLVNYAVSQPEDLGELEEMNLDGLLINTFFAGSPLIASLTIPVINLSSTYDDLPFKQVITDDVATGRDAALHLLGKGFRSFAYWGGSTAWSRQRYAGFVSAVRTALPHEGSVRYSTVPRERLPEWLVTLPRPTGLMTANDAMAAQVVAACRSAGIPVPRDIAVIGVDDDELYCEVSVPPLTSVGQQTERIGYLGAAALLRLIAGQTLPQVTTVPPGMLIPRDSTDAIVVDDPLVVQAIRFMQAHLSAGTNVKHVAANLNVSRRALEMRFHAATGQTPGKHLRQMKIEFARLLLATTDLSIAEISRLAGFGAAIRLSQAFRQVTGQTASQYRRQFSMKSVF